MLSAYKLIAVNDFVVIVVGYVDVSQYFIECTPSIHANAALTTTLPSFARSTTLVLCIDMQNKCMQLRLLNREPSAVIECRD